MTLSIALYVIGVIGVLEHLHGKHQPLEMVKVGAAFVWPVIYSLYIITLLLETMIGFLATMWRRLSRAGSVNA